jgi:hypothetical protein
MSVYGMKPVFKTREEYLEWRTAYREVYSEISNRIRETKRSLVLAEKARNPAAGSIARKLREQRVMARKLLTVRDEGKKRATQIYTMKKEMAEHRAQFPLELNDVRNVEFHFNKKHLEFSWVPMWVVKAKGQSYYVNHVDATAPWTTRENPSHPSTKGSIRVRRCDLRIDAEGTAFLTEVKATEATE